MYHATTGLSCFAEALVALKKGTKVARRGWNGKGMFVALCSNWNGAVDPGSQNFKLLDFIYMRTAQGDIVPWLASQTDLLSEDWEPAILPWEQNQPTHESSAKISFVGIKIKPSAYPPGVRSAVLAQDDLVPGYHTTITDWAAA